MPETTSAPGVQRWGSMKLGDVQPAYDLIDRIVKEGPELYLKFIAEHCVRGLRSIGSAEARKTVQLIADTATEADRADWSEGAD